MAGMRRGAKKVERYIYIYICKYTYICKSKGIICHTWQQVKHEGEEQSKFEMWETNGKITRNEKVTDNYRIF